MLAIASTACDDSDESVVEIGVIEHYAVQTQIEVPSSVTRGVQALVRVTTFGDGCISLEDTEVHITADGAEITPYDRRTPPKCTANLNHFSHEAYVSFDSLGPKTIVVNGHSYAADRSTQLVKKAFTLTVVE